MAKQRVDKSTWVWWKVVAPLRWFLVEAGSEEDARRKALIHTRLEHKPYLARDWKFTVATEADKQAYATLADAVPPSEPTAKTVKKGRKSVEDRLFGG